MEEDETFAYLTFPKIPPQKLVGDYLRSKLEERALRRYPQWDIPRADPIMNLVAAKRELHHAEAQVAKKKEEAKERRKELDLQWEGLRKDAAKLKETFLEFDGMVKQNSQKRERAVKKTEKQVVLQIERDKAIKELQTEYDKLSKIKDKMECQVRKHKIYEDYLQTVSDACPEYRNPKEVFNRFGALEEVRNSLTAELDGNIKELENIKSEMLELSAAQSSKLIGMGNTVAALYNRYNAAKNKAQKWEEIVDQIQIESMEKLLEILNVRQACWNLYLEMCSRRKIKPRFDESDFENQLAFIKKTMLRLGKTVEIAQKKASVDFSSVRAESPHSKRRL